MAVKKKYYPSSAAFMWGKIVFTDYYGSGCLRRILIQQNGVRETIDKKHMIRGAWNEEKYAERLRNSEIGFQSEVETKAEIGSTGITRSGRIDFLVDRNLDGTYSSVEELKSTESKNVRSSVINRGEFKSDNLAQLVSYMIAKELVNGKLVHTYYEKDKDGNYVRPEPKKWRGKIIESERIFEVYIDEFGRIHVDGEPTQWTVYDQLAHQHAAAHVLNTGEVWERPYNFDAVWNSPCQYCPFRETCEKWDQEEISTTEELINEARTEIVRRSKG